jgi:hypothetical protein
MPREEFDDQVAAASLSEMHADRPAWRQLRLRATELSTGADHGALVRGLREPVRREVASRACKAERTSGKFSQGYPCAQAQKTASARIRVEAFTQRDQPHGRGRTVGEMARRKT